MKLTTTILCVLCVLTSAQAQNFQVVGATVQLDGYSEADNSCYNPDFCIFPTPSIDFYSANAFVNGGLGSDLGLSRGHRVSEDDGGGFCCGTSPTFAHSNNFGYATVDGNGTDFITIKYGLSGYAQAGNDNLYKCRVTDTLQFAILLEIDGGPAGFPVIADYSWDHFGGIGGAHDAMSEDCVFTNASLNVDTDGEVLQNRFNFGSGAGGVFGWNRRNNQGGQFNRVIGDQLLITGRFEIDVNTNVPSPFPAQTLDDQSASQWGTIRLSLGTPIVPVPPDGLNAGSWLEFSVDIGGDCEMSDPTPDGNEFFDPGDSYMWQGPPMPPGGMDGTTNDEILNGFDMPPVAPDGPPPLTGAPVGSGLSYPDVATAYFDLDGEDYLDFSINQFGYGPGDPPIGRFDTPCIFDGNNLFVSFDDDLASLYTSVAGSAPLNSPSPVLATHGQASSGDEVIGLSVFTTTQPATVFFKYPFLTESLLHPNLFPDPLPFSDQDDDADALDIRDNQCPIWYFTVDHEASFGLDPGTIYMKVGGGPGGGFVGVIDPTVHLGLLFGVDIDAFEFIWLYDQQSGGDGLALLFSVNDDDFATPQDESSGLDPRMLYASFLNGSSFPFLDAPLEDDIDALATWGTPLYAGYVDPPQNCLPAENLVIAVDVPNSTVTLMFDSPQDALYEIFSTTDPALPPPPSPGWVSEGDVPGVAGQVVVFSISYPSLDPERIYQIISTCP